MVVDFYATWCGPCKMIAPQIEVLHLWYFNVFIEFMIVVLQAMSKEFEDVVFIKVDVDECEDVASDYNISCMPTFMLLKNGSKVRTN